MKTRVPTGLNRSPQPFGSATTSTLTVSMAFSSADLLHAMTADAGLDVGALRVDGGATANDWLMQCQADLPAGPITGVLSAHELLDNLPFRLAVYDGGWREAVEVEPRTV